MHASKMGWHSNNTASNNLLVNDQELGGVREKTIWHTIHSLNWRKTGWPAIGARFYDWDSLTKQKHAGQISIIQPSEIIHDLVLRRKAWGLLHNTCSTSISAIFTSPINQRKPPATFILKKMDMWYVISCHPLWQVQDPTEPFSPHICFCPSSGSSSPHLKVCWMWRPKNWLAGSPKMMGLKYVSNVWCYGFLPIKKYTLESNSLEAKKIRSWNHKILEILNKMDVHMVPICNHVDSWMRFQKTAFREDIFGP